jgi:hypothetical protein
MVKLVYKVLFVDIVLVVALYFVLQDLQWRTSYAASPHDACGGLCTYAPSFGYGIFTRVFTMSGNGVGLASPLMVDWVQILAVLLALVNGWYLYVVLRARKPQSLGTPPI